MGSIMTASVSFYLCSCPVPNADPNNLKYHLNNPTTGFLCTWGQDVYVNLCGEFMLTTCIQAIVAAGAMILFLVRDSDRYQKPAISLGPEESE